MSRKIIVPFIALFSAGLTACQPTPGPDKAIAGAVLGAGWGAGTGAIVGNQVGSPGPGAGIGAGIGAGAGLMSGAGLDVMEGTQLQQQREIDALKVEIEANRRDMVALQDQLDSNGRKINASPAEVSVFFDEGRASLKGGAAAQLERLADSIKLDPAVRVIEIHGHSDDSGSAETNVRLAEARARSVQTFLAVHGISVHEMRIVGHGSQQPLANNGSEAGRQLNRRVEVVLVK